MAVNIFQVGEFNADLFNTSSLPTTAGVFASELPLLPDNINAGLSRYTKIAGIWPSALLNSTTGYPAGSGSDSWAQPNGNSTSGIAWRPNGGYFARGVWTTDQNTSSSPVQYSSFGYVGSFVGGYNRLDYTFDLNPGPITGNQVSAADYEPPYGHGANPSINVAPINNVTNNQWRDSANLTSDASAQVTVNTSSYSRSPYGQPAYFVAQIDNSVARTIGSGLVTFHVEMRPTQLLSGTGGNLPGNNPAPPNGSRAPLRQDWYGFPLNNTPSDFYFASNNRKFGSRALSVFWGRIFDGQAAMFAYPYYEDQTFATYLGTVGGGQQAFADLVYSDTAIADNPTSRPPQFTHMWIPNTAYALNFEIIDRMGHVQKVTTAGTSGASNPSWNDSGGMTPDGAGSLIWTDQGLANAYAGPALAYNTDNRTRSAAMLTVNGEYQLFVQETKFAITSNKAPVYPLVYLDLVDTWNAGTWALGFRIGGAAVWNETTPWAAGTPYIVGQSILDTNGNIQVVTSISGTGTSGGAHPVWNTAYNGTTIDNPGANQVVWTNYGINSSKIYFIAENGHLALFDSNVANSSVTALATAPALASGRAYGALAFRSGFAQVYAVTGSFASNPTTTIVDSVSAPGAGFVGVTPFSIVPGTWGAASYPALNARHNARSLSEMVRLRNGNFALLVENVAVASPNVSNAGVAPVTNVSLTGNVATITAANNFLANEIVFFSGLTGATFLNGQALQVLSTGLSGTQFQVGFAHANYASTPDTGTAMDIEWQLLLFNPSASTWNTSAITGDGTSRFGYGTPSGNTTFQNNVSITYENAFNCSVYDVANTVAGNGLPVILVQSNWRSDRMFVIDGSQPLATIGNANVANVSAAAQHDILNGTSAPAYNFALSSVNAAVGGTTTYNGSFNPSAATLPIGSYVTITGFTNAANNGRFTIAAGGTSSVIVLNNAAGVAETHAANAYTGVPSPLQIRKSVTDDRTLFWFNEAYSFIQTSGTNTSSPGPTNFYLAPPSWALSNWNQTTVGAVQTINQNTKDGNGNVLTIDKDKSFLTDVSSHQGNVNNEPYSLLGAFQDHSCNVLISGGVDNNGSFGEYGIFSNQVQLFGHNNWQATFYLPTYFKWNGTAFVMADNYAQAAANPAPVSSTPLTNISLPYGLVAQFGTVAGSSFGANEWFTINVAWGNTKYVRKARYVWSMFPGQTFLTTQSSIPMSSVNSVIPTVTLAEAFGSANVAFPATFNNPGLTGSPSVSQPSGFTAGIDNYLTCANWPMVFGGAAQTNAAQIVMTVNHPNPSTILNRPNQANQVYRASSNQAAAPPANAFNGCPWPFTNNSSLGVGGAWIASAGGNQWIAIDLGSAQTANSYSFNNAALVNNGGNDFLTAWTLYGSNSATDFTNGPPGGSWVTIDTQSGVAQTRSFADNIDTPGSYRYYALLATAYTSTAGLGYFRLFNSTMQTTMNFSEILAFGPNALMGQNSNSSAMAPSFMRGMTFEVSTNSGSTYTPIVPFWRAHLGGIWCFPRQTGVTNVRITVQSGYPWFNQSGNIFTNNLAIGPFQFVDYQVATIDSTFAARLGSSAATDGTPTRGSFDSQFMGVSCDAVSVSIDATVSAASLGQQYTGSGVVPDSNGTITPAYAWWSFTQIPTGNNATFPNGFIRVHPAYGFVLFGGPQPGTISFSGGCDQNPSLVTGGPFAGTNMAVTYHWGRRT